MKIFALLLLICSAHLVNGQNFYLPEKSLQDSEALKKYMPVLASQLIEVQKKNNPKDFDNLFRFQIVAGQYDDALSAIDSVQKLDPDTAESKGVGIQFKTYCLATKQLEGQNTSFDSLYATVLKMQGEKLTENAQFYLGYYFNSNPSEMKANWNKSVADQLSKHSDSISYNALKIFVRTYTSKIVYEKILDIGKPIADEIIYKDYLVQDTVKIPMRDGAVIAAVVMRKKSNTAPLPAILKFNIYAGPVDMPNAKAAAAHDFVGVVANTRGKRIRSASIEPFEHDATDAYDIIDWISKQPWCNGTVGMYGGSYLGFSQWAASKYRHPALKTIVPQVSVGAGIDYPMSHNVFMSYMLQWIHFVTNHEFSDNADFGNADHWNKVNMDYYTSGRSFRSLDTIEGRPDKIFQRWLQHPAFDSYWKNMTPDSSDFSKLNIPILTLTGYYDDDQGGALYYLRSHLKYNNAAEHYLVIGPYDHYGPQGRLTDPLMGYALDSVAKVDFNEMVFQWFNYILKKDKKPAFLKDKVNFQVMGTNQWFHASSIEAPAFKNYYLGKFKSADQLKLSYSNSLMKDYTNYIIDLANRSDTATEAVLATPEVVDQNVNGLHNKILFSSDPLEKDTYIFGSFEGALKIKINKKDADLRMTLYELLPDSRYVLLSDNLFRASYVANNAKRQLLIPGQKITLPIPMSTFVSKKLVKGSKLILVFGVQKGKDWQINYGSGKEVSDETIKDAGKPMQIQIFNNSVIKIPVLK